MFDVLLATGEVIIHDDYFVTVHHQTVNQMRPNKASSASYLFENDRNLSEEGQ